MMELDDEARALLELARDAHDPSDHDRARVQAALAARLGTAAGLGLAAGLGSAAKASAAAGAGSTAGVLGAGVTVKAIGLAVLVSVSVGVGATSIRRARHTPAARVAVDRPSLPSRQSLPDRPVLAPVPVAATPLPPALARARTGPTANVPPPEAPPAEAALEKSVLPASAVAPVRAEAGAPVAAPVSVIHDSGRSAVVASGLPEATAARVEVPAGGGRFGLADEAHLIHAAVAALRAGRAAQALSLFETHALFYPRGVLAEERDAERALALADLGRVAEARAAIDQFLRAHPASPLGARLREREVALAGP